ncbi:MAG: lytic transglycosylase protein [Caproiciproducens sp.]|nr:lytic transglycosylase protein [Caproiciproducens sp.]
MKVFKKVIVTCIILVVLLLLGYFALNRANDYFMKKSYPLEYSDIVAKEATANHLDPALVYSVMKAESNFNPDAQSHAGAIGLMQLTPDTFAWIQTKLKSEAKYTEQDLYTPEVNIRYGCKLLSMLLDKYSQTGTALGAYNAGIGTVNSWLKNPDISKDGTSLDNIPYAETKNYVSAVLKNYDNYRKLYQFNSKGENNNG